MAYTKLNSEIIAKLQAILGAENVLTEEEKLQPYSHDEVPDPSYQRLPEAVGFAHTAQQVAAVVRLANEFHFPVVPRGTGTGLACGAVATSGGLVLSLEKMNKIIEINKEAMYAVVEPGVLTSALQAAVEEQGLFYAGDPCSGDSCCIGGNIATNAGGNRAVKYGTTRHQVYAIEVVNPTGHIVNLGARLRKQSTGYCLEQLVMGSEGTLGIITKATLKLLPKPRYSMDLLAVYPDPSQAIASVGKIAMAGLVPTCVEYMDNVTIKSVERYLNVDLPGSQAGNYLIVEIEGTNEDDLDEKAVALDELCTAAGASEVLVAEHDRIWRARKVYSEAARAESLVIAKEDVVVPVEQEPVLFQRILDLAAKYQLVTRIAAHAGDGNIHLNVLKLASEDYQAWEEKVGTMQRELYRTIYQLGGRLSGEHGIGYKRKHLMEEFTDPEELAMMRAVKKALDPNNILNPGKIFDL